MLNALRKRLEGKAPNDLPGTLGASTRRIPMTSPGHWDAGMVMVQIERVLGMVPDDSAHSISACFYGSPVKQGSASAQQAHGLNKEPLTGGRSTTASVKPWHPSARHVVQNQGGCHGRPDKRVQDLGLLPHDCCCRWWAERGWDVKVWV